MQMIDTTKPAVEKNQDNQSQREKDDDCDEERSEDEDGESPTKSLNDVWIFDTHLKKWFEIDPPLYI